jgi:LysM repeat protein
LKSAQPSSDKLQVADDGSTRYQVQPGDSLGYIASHLGTTVQHLQSLNNLYNPNRIYPGQVLLISAGSGGYPVTPLRRGESLVYSVRPGDTLELIAKRFGTSIDQIQSANAISNPNRIHPGMKLNISNFSNPAAKRYTVRKGDTLLQIARRFGSSIDKIKNVNGIDNANQIRQGQEILIPQ